MNTLLFKIFHLLALYFSSATQGAKTRTSVQTTLQTTSNTPRTFLNVWQPLRGMKIICVLSFYVQSY